LALPSGNLISWRYTCDDGSTHYRISTRKAITDQLDGSDVKVGGSAAQSGDMPPPPGFEPRKAYVSNGAVVRGVTIFELAAPLLTKGATISLAYGADIATFTMNGSYTGESLKIGNQTSS